MQCSGIAVSRCVCGGWPSKHDFETTLAEVMQRGRDVRCVFSEQVQNSSLEHSKKSPASLTLLLLSALVLFFCSPLRFHWPVSDQKVVQGSGELTENPLGVNMNLKLILWNDPLLSYHYHSIVDNSRKSSMSKTLSHVLKVSLLLQPALPRWFIYGQLD